MKTEEQKPLIRRWLCPSLILGLVLSLAALPAFGWQNDKDKDKKDKEKKSHRCIHGLVNHCSKQPPQKCKHGWYNHHRNNPPKNCKNPPPTNTVTITYSGQATMVYLTNGNMEPTTISFGDTGPLPSTGGTLEVSIGQTNISSLSLGMGHAITMGAGNEARSQVQLQNFSFTFHVTNGDLHTVTFTTLSAEASATCLSNGQAQVAFTSTITGLTFDNTNVVVTGQPNQMIDFPFGALIINFQQGGATGGVGDILGAGLVLALQGCMHGGIGIVHADIQCQSGGGQPPPPPPVECDRITGGGWIVGTPSGDKGNFGVHGGIRRGTPVGHLNYIDHDTGMHVRSTSLVSYSAVDADIRQLVFNVDVDGEVGTATVLVADYGEPGVDDLFDITLSNGYHAGGDLGGTHHGGGNIQLHKCPPGWMR